VIDNAGQADAFVRKYDPIGNTIWTQQFGSAGSEDSKGVALDGLGNVYAAGETSGNFGGQQKGVYDAFVLKLLDFPGDFNRDFIVDAADYVIWRDQLGIVVPRCSGADANCNGFVEVGDYQPWKENFGRTLPAAAGGGIGTALRGAPSVPEPSSAGLLVLATAFWFRVMRSRGMVGFGFASSNNTGPNGSHYQ
jgi:hypothetical protein